MAVVVSVPVRLPEALLDWLAKRAVREGITMDEIIERACWARLIQTETRRASMLASCSERRVYDRCGDVRIEAEAPHDDPDQLKLWRGRRRRRGGKAL